MSLVDESKNARQFMAIAVSCATVGGTVWALVLGARRFMAGDLVTPVSVTVLVLCSAALTWLLVQRARDDRRDLNRRLEERAAEIVALVSEQARMREAADADKRAALRILADEFEAGVHGVLDHVARTADDLRQRAESALSAGQRAQDGLLAADGIATRSQTGLTEISRLTGDLSRSLGETRPPEKPAPSIEPETTDLVRTGQQAIEALERSAKRTAMLAEIVEGIASQMNLIALNATVESTRAGAAGRGFASVAADVKAMAATVALASDEVARTIGDLQQATRVSVDGIQAMQRSLKEPPKVDASEDPAIAEQATALARIAEQAAEAATAAQERLIAMLDVRQALDQTGEAATAFRDEAAELKQKAADAGRRVTEFVKRVRAA